MAISEGSGWKAAQLEDLGEGPGFRKVRGPLDVTAFGVNAIVLPEGSTSVNHSHERQEELYFVHAGEIELRFGDGSSVELAPGGFAKVDAETVRSLTNVGSGEATYVCVGGKDGYVGRDGVPAQ